MRISIVGAGVVGTALAVRWREDNHDIAAVSGRGDATYRRAADYLPGVPVQSALEAAAASGIVVIGVPDDDILPVCAELVEQHVIGPGDTVLHLSGATTLAALQPAADVHAEILSLHPLQTFPSVDAALQGLPGSPMAVTATTAHARSLGHRLAADAGAVPFDLDDEAKPLYHAAAVLASNALVAILGGAEELMTGAGVHDPHLILAALERASFENAQRLGPARALTGPAVRGDAGTVARNLEAISRESPALVPVYVAVTHLALRVAGERVSDEGRLAVEEVLDTWR